MKIFPIRKRLLRQENQGRFYTTIKKPKTPKTKVCINYPNSGALELWNFSNLTFGRSLAVTKLVLSVMQILSKAREDSEAY